MRPILLLLCAATLSLSACVDYGSYTDDKGTVHRNIDPKEIPPHNGMSRDEVFRMYGPPNRRFADDMGETFVYYLNAGEIEGKSFIPFYIPPRLRTGVLTFGPDGRVVRYHWEPDPYQRGGGV